jgi:hypothetical protein
LGWSPGIWLITGPGSRVAAAPTLVAMCAEGVARRGPGFPPPFPDC